MKNPEASQNCAFNKAAVLPRKSVSNEKSEIARPRERVYLNLVGAVKHRPPQQAIDCATLFDSSSGYSLTFLCRRKDTAEAYTNTVHEL